MSRQRYSAAANRCLRRPRARSLLTIGWLAAAIWWIGGCAPLMEAAGVRTTKAPVQQVPGGDPSRGAVALRAYGCGACHTIPGVPMANALVGPPLNSWGERQYIAGRLLNEPAHLVEWIRFPQAIEPGTAMPNMGVSEQDARDMAAYLYTLGRD